MHPAILRLARRAGSLGRNLGSRRLDVGALELAPGVLLLELLAPGAGRLAHGQASPVPVGEVAMKGRRLARLRRRTGRPTGRSGRRARRS